MAFSIFGGAKRAGKKQSRAYNQAINDTQAGFDSAQGRLSSIANDGMGAQQSLLAALGVLGSGQQGEFFQNFSDGPDVEFSLNRGLGAIERSAANRGNLFSGRTGTALSEFAQGVGEQSLRDRLTRLSALGSQGINATNNLANLDTARAGQLANLRIGKGNASANAVIGNQNESLGLLKGIGQLAGFGLGGGFQSPTSGGAPSAFKGIF